MFTKCYKCSRGNFNSNSYEFNIKYSEWHQIVDIQKVKGKLVLKAPISAYLTEKELILNMKLSQEVRIMITANTIENAIIQNNIANNEIKQNLTELCNKLKGKEIVEFYTDGAMEINKATGNKMGIGWIAKLENEIVREISFSCSLEK